MSDDVRGIAGDRRRNPFPSLNDTEYELFLLTIREQVTAGVTAAMLAYRRDNCEDHMQRTEHLEACVFGRTESGLVGLDQRMATMERTVNTWDDDRKWFKRMLYGALTVATIGLLVAVAQVIVLGR